MHRFFIDREQIRRDTVMIEGEDAEHIHRVLRLRRGDTIELCDGQGNDYEAVIKSVGKNGVEVHIKRNFPSQGEPRVKVVLYQAIPKSAKMDLIIQKCVELGVHRIVPVVTARTIVKLTSTDDEIKKVSRWQRIAREAAKQSRRGIIPEVSLPVPFSRAIHQSPEMLRIFPWENERKAGLKNLFESSSSWGDGIAIMVGPEGGWEEQEVEAAREMGWNTVSLGPRILRTETVGVAILSAIMFYTGEMQWTTE
ncbi:16S rRNA (uracil(1498)-N(3))-methyltransferase [Caldicoprobacter algeriensis]|uniref:16S rRNA (uracil(1498)-N(3))-methyltransferase n=1 Tax=Caldicoprobacter algeriensis TaxID=699281 RepID=UPI00207AAB70|nr:16S rRNA (uracil(1498)-N(3))-methyltransferase [Caldicoprobacter algeriensis]MCM8899835.1 16S rRNA (uracil(1498)-N(3))-methyltransferase [Caldicoprobacter algeriensis]